MSRIRFGVTLLAGAALALVVLGPASARAPARSTAARSSSAWRGEPSTPRSDAEPASGAAVEVYRAICEQLYDTNGKSQLVPELAAALPAISKDKLTYTIQLRQGIQFNDGTPFNAQAVVTTLQRYMTLPRLGPRERLRAVDSVTASGPYTVVST